MATDFHRVKAPMPVPRTQGRDLVRDFPCIRTPLTLPEIHDRIAMRGDG
jgi:hypothetical protein